MVGRIARRRPKITWRRHVVKEVEESRLKKEDMDRPKWRDAINKLSRITT